MRFRIAMPLMAWLSVSVLATAPAFAGDSITVLAQVTPDAGITASEIRQAVVAELGDAVSELSGQGGVSSDVLFVAVNLHQAVLAFCPGTGGGRRRTIDVPEDVNDRRRIIAWIAVNLVKNQVADLVGAEPHAHQTEKAAQASAPVEPASLEPPPLEPRSSEAMPVASSTPTMHAKIDEPAQPRGPWRVSVFGGYSMYFLGNRNDSHWVKTPNRAGTEWQIELTKRLPDWTYGVALDVTDRDSPAGGVAGVIGDEWRRGRLGLEVAAGVGLELTKRAVATTHQTLNSDASPVLAMDISNDFRPRVYGRGNGSLVWHAGRATDAFMRLALHIETDDRTYTYATALLGLSVGLP